MNRPALRGRNASLFAIIIVLLSLMFPLRAGIAAPGTVVAVDPKETMTKVGQTFSVNVNITDVSGLVGFDFELSYNSSILQLTDVQEGPFLKSAGSTFLINKTTTGQIWLASLLFSTPGWTGPSANGSGVLATATFKAIAVGESSLTLFSKNSPNGIELAADPEDPPVVAIPNIALSGHVTVSSDPDPSDPPQSIAYALPFQSAVGKGYNLRIILTVTNPSGLPETFNVACYANATEIGKQTLSLPNGNSSIPFPWNTSGFAYGNYSISACATLAPAKTDMANATIAANGWAIVTIPGDISGDFKVGLADLTLLGKAYGSRQGGSNWNPNADILEDGVASLADLVILAQNYGQHYP